MINKESKKLDSFKEVSQLYDFFIVDIYGVIYDGLGLVREALIALDDLRKNSEKKIVFLSNSPRPSLSVKTKLMNADHSNEFSDLWNEVVFITSGDFFVDYFIQNYDELFNEAGMLIGADIKHDVMQKIISELEKNNLAPLKFTKNISEARYMIMLAYNMTHEIEKIEEIQKLITEAAKFDLLCICPNPDVSAPYGVKRMYTAGFYAQQYQKLGGTVSFFGKPHNEIYEIAFKELFRGGERILDKTLVIGDSMRNDILGAHNVGVNSLLIGSADDIREYNVLESSMTNNQEGESIVPQYLVPTYYMPHF